MLHARDHLLTDETALAEIDAGVLVERYIVREGVPRLEIRAALGDAMGDPQGRPAFRIVLARWLAAIVARDPQLFRETAVAHRAPVIRR